MTSPALLAEARRLGIVSEQCSECRDQRTIHMLGEDFPCPFCCPDDYNERLIEHRINVGEIGS